VKLCRFRQSVLLKSRHHRFRHTDDRVRYRSSYAKLLPPNEPLVHAGHLQGFCCASGRRPQYNGRRWTDAKRSDGVWPMRFSALLAGTRTKLRIAAPLMPSAQVRSLFARSSPLGIWPARRNLRTHKAAAPAATRWTETMSYDLYFWKQRDRRQHPRDVLNKLLVRGAAESLWPVDFENAIFANSHAQTSFRSPLTPGVDRHLFCNLRLATEPWQGPLQLSLADPLM